MHVPVLLKESIDSLNIKEGEIFIDGTLGRGGHSREVCKRFGGAVAMIGIDLDTDAIDESKTSLIGCNVKYCQGSFRNIDKISKQLGINKADKILLDIGLSSNQFEESGRGFSFQKNEPLLMTFKKEISDEDLTAKEILNSWDEKNIEIILKSYGEERFARRIAGGIVKAREIKPIETTDELVEIIKSNTPKAYHFGRIHPATRTFQALRITVNDEIESLKEGMKKSFDILNSSGRLAIISFHSLEDREIKRFFKEKEDLGEGIRINKKPIIPSEEEIINNPRSRSAKLRVIEKI